MTKGQLLPVARTLQEQRKFSFSLADVAAHYDTGPGFSEEGPIFTDGHAPANVLRQQLERSYTRYSPPVPAFERAAVWLRNHRFLIVSVAAAVVIGALALHRI